MVRCFCDRCGRELASAEVQKCSIIVPNEYHVFSTGAIKYSASQGIHEEIIELCPDCAFKLGCNNFTFLRER